MIRVECTIQVFELGVNSQESAAQPSILVRNHWNRHDLVVLCVNGQEYTVKAEDLQVAVSNAIRTAKY